MKEKETGATYNTAGMCNDLLIDSISVAQEIYGCKVKTIETGSAKNMEKMQKTLTGENWDMVSYSCLADWLNLLGQDLTPSRIIKHFVEINEYFCNHHFPGALLKNPAGSVKPQLPENTRWKSRLHCVDTFVTNYSFFMQIVKNPAEVIDLALPQENMNSGLFRQVSYSPWHGQGVE